MHPLIDAFHAFSHECSAQESRGGQPETIGSEEPQVHLCKHWWKPSMPADPCSSQAAPPDAPEVSDRCVCSLPASPRTFCTESTAWTASVSWGKTVLWFHLHLHQIQSMYSRVHRSNFCSSFRLIRLACDNGSVFKVFWKKLAGGHGHVKQGTVFAKTFCQFIQTDGKAVLCERPCSRSSEMKNKM